MIYNNWTTYNNAGNPTDLKFTLGSAQKCLKLV